MSKYPTHHSNVLGAGINLKPQHVPDALSGGPQTDTTQKLWFEVHTENFFVAGGPRLDALHAIRSEFPVSFHGVGASLGNRERLDNHHIQQVKQLVDRFQPTLISEHAVWSAANNTYFADLLPLPRTQDALNQLISGIDEYQSGIGRSILIENPTNYLQFNSEMDEPEFLVEAAIRSGCGLLLDVNNLYLSSQNCGMDAAQYINSLPVDLVGEIHIAGYSVDPNLGQTLLIDSHAAEVSEPVWALLELALQRFGAQPILLERDDNIPSFSALMSERQRAQQSLIGTPLDASPSTKAG